jgi:hypothetical protein
LRLERGEGEGYIFNTRYPESRWQLPGHLTHEKGEGKPSLEKDIHEFCLTGHPQRKGSCQGDPWVGTETFGISQGNARAAQHPLPAPRQVQMRDVLYLFTARKLNSQTLHDFMIALAI